MPSPAMNDQEEVSLRRKLNRIQMVMIITTGLSSVAGLGGIVYGFYSFYALILPVLDFTTVLMIPSLILLIIGFLFAYFSVVGCAVALEEDDTKLAITKTAISGFIIISLISTIYVCGLTYSGDLQSHQRLNDAMMGYKYRRTDTAHVDALQKMLKCCGVKSIFDWSRAGRFHCFLELSDLEWCSAPPSCCIEHEKSSILAKCGRNALVHVINNAADTRLEDYYYTEGCQAKLESHIHILVAEMIMVYVFLTLCEVIMFVVVSYMERVIMDYNEERLYRYSFLDEFPRIEE